ncbi:hypothetical protein DRQ23_07055 [bacterium]|nr:MAG: hypothetical protein DRQ23_07055 [bacterium]
MKKALLLTLAIVSLTAFAQEMNFNLMGSGARALGMGGAFIAMSDDASAITWNPAGLTQLIKPEVGIMGGFKMETATLNGDEWYSNSHSTIDFASLVMPISTGFSNLVLAAAYHNMIDVYWDYSYADTSIDSITIISSKVSGAYSAITPAIAIDLPMIAMGVATDIWFKGPTSEYKYYYEASDTNTWDYTRTKNYEVMGVGVVLGGLITPPGGFIKIGATMRLPFQMKYNTEYNVHAIGTGMYTNFDTTYVDSAILHWPMMLGFGVALNFSSLTFSIDYEMRKYSNMEVEQNGTTYNNDLPDCNQFRVGLEYLLSLGPIVIPFRIGFMTDPRTYFNTDSFGNEGDQVIGKYITFGTGLLLPNINFDFSMQIGPSSYTYYGDDVTQSNVNVLASFVFRGM